MSADFTDLSSTIKALQDKRQDLLKIIGAWGNNIERFNRAKKKLSAQSEFNSQGLAALQHFKLLQDETEQLARQQQQNTLLKKLNMDKRMIEHYALGILNLEDHIAKAQAELIELEALIEELIKEPQKSISASTSPEDLDAPTSTQKRFSFGMR